jgi:hypothetical protein
MSNLIGLTINASSNDKFKIYPYNSNNKISYSLKINDSNHIITFHNNEMIGIGTSQPTEKLNIYNGSLRISNNSNKLIDINHNSISFYNSNFDLKGVVKNDGNNYISLYSNLEIKGELLINEFRPINNQWHRTNDNKNRFYFLSNSATILESPNGYEIRTTNCNIYINNQGNLGIGITNPLNNLHIISDNQFPFKISSKSIHNNGTFISLNTEICNWTKCGIGHIRTSNFDIGDLIFMTNNNLNSNSINLNDERLRIKSTGLIGIGITNPNANLHINNNQVKLRLTEFNNNSNGLLLMKSNNSFILNENNNDLILGSAGKEIVRLTSNGNFNLPIGILNFTSNKAEINANNYPIIKYENLNINFGSSETKTIFNNYVGIGSISPIELLHVQGTIASINNTTKNHIRILNDNSSGFLDIGNDINGFAIRINNSGQSYGNNNYIERFRIKTDGNVGIGNNNPITNLNDVNLTIGNSSLNTSSGFLIISKGASDFKRHFKFGYGTNNFIAIGDFGTNNSSGTWKEQIRFHWNTPNNALVLFENGDLNIVGRLYQASDRKIKKEIKTIDSALEKVEKLNGVEFKGIDNNIEQIGLIAQEVEEIIPQVVNYNQETDLKSVSYANLVPLLINAIKELNKKITKN